MITFEQLDQLTKDCFAKANLSGEPADLYAPIEYMIAIGGKRLRPKFCLLAYSLFKDGFDDEIINPAIGMEVFHEFTLIHDDIMDKSDMRRGYPTVHVKWSENAAILSGDVMSIVAYKFIAGAPKDKLSDVLYLFSKTAAEVCEGQQYDMDFESRETVSMDEYMKMIGLKTGVLLACSATMGALIAGAEKKTCEAIYRYAHSVGLAFQIMDDYLDSFGDVKVFGKPIGKDIMCKKKNWLLTRALETAGEARAKEILDLMNSEDENRVQKILDIYTELGIGKAALAEVERYHREAYSYLEDADMTPQARQQLIDFADTLTHRNK